MNEESERTDWGFYILYDGNTSQGISQHNDRGNRGEAVGIIDLTNHADETGKNYGKPDYPRIFDWMTVINSKGHKYFLYYDYEEISEAQFETYREFGVSVGVVSPGLDRFMHAAHIEVSYGELPAFVGIHEEYTDRTSSKGL